MRDQDRTREQVTSELTAAQQRVAELEALECEREQAEIALLESHRYTEAIIETFSTRAGTPNLGNQD